MFKWSRKRKITELAESAKEYVNINYKELPLSQRNTVSDIKYNIEISHDIETKNSCGEGQRIKYSFRSDSGQNTTGTNETDIKYSNRDIQNNYRDSYNSQSIDRIVNSLSSSNSPLRALKELENNTNMSFVDKMLDYINIKHLRDSDVYKAAQIDRRLFSKIVSDRTYKPAKDTCIALALALRLSLPEANDILSRAGYVLSHSSKRDVVIEYFFRENIYSLNDVNEILFHLEQKLIGR